jgi:hypothetical protein
MKKVFGLIVLVMILSIAALPVAAQDCVAAAQAALARVKSACELIGAGEMCVALGAGEPVISAIDDIDSLTLSGVNAEASTWGSALAKTSTGATLLLLGGVQFSDAAQTAGVPLTLSAQANTGSNVREGASTNTAIVGGLIRNEAVTVNGRLEDSSWLRVQLEDGIGGWVRADLLDLSADAAFDLPVVAPGDALDASPTVTYAPFEAINFLSGDSGCEGVSPAGIIARNSSGAAETRLIINGVDITFSGAIFVQANAEMVVGVLSGRADVTARRETRNLPAGTQVVLPLASDDIRSVRPTAAGGLLDTFDGSLPASADSIFFG